MKENEGKERLLKVMKNDGWKCRKLNVSAGIYSTPDFPDVYAVHPHIRDLLYYHNKPLYEKIKNYIGMEELHTGYNDNSKTLLNHQEIMLIQPYRWIECKIPKGKLSVGQSELIGQWNGCGVGVWVLFDESDYSKLFQPPNAWQLALRGRIR